MTELLFSGATVYTPEGPREADVRVADGVITAVEPRGASAAGATAVRLDGLYLLPGAIDVHVHSRDPGFPEKEDFGTLTAAAAAGGVTTVVDMPNTVPAVDAAGTLEGKAALARARARVSASESVWSEPGHVRSWISRRPPGVVTMAMKLPQYLPSARSSVEHTTVALPVV